MDVTVGICSRNRCGLLEKVLLSLADQTLAPDRYEVVLVDDGSTDDTPAMARRVEVPYTLVYLRQPHSGLSTARNTGIRRARGRVMVYIDDDVLGDRRLLEEHLRSHEAHDKCVVNGWVNHVTEPLRPESPVFTMADISTSFFWTSNVSVKTEHLIACGMFDEDFKEYGWEDQEVGLRLMALGLKARNNYRAIGYHVKRPTRWCDVPRVLLQTEAKARTALIYIRKHPRMRARLSTGTHPPRVAMAALMNFGGMVEAYCRRCLGLDRDPRPEDERPLAPHESFCLRQLSTIHYYRTLRSHRPESADSNRWSMVGGG
ncbi:MAG: glycosyltransferase [Armatimonadetes bacterium]|nr:glycosyltransferase [Armatimonadota bacterium]